MHDVAVRTNRCVLAPLVPDVEFQHQVNVVLGKLSADDPHIPAQIPFEISARQRREQHLGAVQSESVGHSRRVAPHGRPARLHCPSGAHQTSEQGLVAHATLDGSATFEEVCEALRQVARARDAVVVLWRLRWPDASLLEERHGVDRFVDAAPESDGDLRLRRRALLALSTIRRSY